jgi:hypothetical protein
MQFPGKFKGSCIACGAVATKMNKEHFWPQWLIRRTGTHRTGVRFDPSKRVNPRKLTIPICIRCNTDFGRELEEPTKRIFEDIENGRGISDTEAEILVRWLWKFEGLAWRIHYPHGQYSARYTLRDRVLNPLDEIREELTLAISIAKEIDPEFDDEPMGLDSRCKDNAVFVSGVFSRIALMVVDREFECVVPSEFGLYRLAAADSPGRNAKLFFPPTGFDTCVRAVGVTYQSSLLLSYLHDRQVQSG